MPTDFKAISEEEMLNYEGATTAVMDRYRRIMQHRSNEAAHQLARQLNGVTETVYRAAQGAQTKADQFIAKADEMIAKADEAIASAKATASEQRKQQRAMTALTVALVVSTFAYTYINWRSMREASRGNQIQATIAAVAGQQVAVSREANELQRNLLRSSVPKSGEAGTATTTDTRVIPKK